MDNTNLKETLIKYLEEAKNVCCDGTTGMVLELICENIHSDTKLDVCFSGRTIYLKDKNNYTKLATIKIYKEKLARGEGMISSLDSYKLFI